MVAGENVIPEFRVSEIFGTQLLIVAPGSRLSAHSRSGRDDSVAGSP
jgi:hypothetical protein